jgi:hypothetical protein
MILGMSTSAFTTLHVVISLIGIASGFIVVFGLIGGKRTPMWTMLFLVTTVLTSVTGFLFPYKGITPGIVIGILSLIVLVLAIYALYGAHLAGAWRGTYVISVALAEFFNFFVLVVQSFQKIPALHAMAPTQSELPFKVAQLGSLVLFAVLTALAYKKFRVV